MRLFGRHGEVDQSSPPSARTHAAPRLNPDQNSVIRELSGLVIDGMRDCPIEESTLGLLQVGLPYLTQRERSDAAIIAGQTAARLGYLARGAEYVMFEPAQELDDELLDTLAARLDDAGPGPHATENTVAELAAELANGEPIDAPAGEEGAFSLLPGAGGELRVALRDRLAGALSRPDDVSLYELRQTWMYGYFLRCLQECFEDEDMTG